MTIAKKNSILKFDKYSTSYHPRYYPNIIQISSKNDPEIIQKSSRNHPDIIQSTSIFTAPQLGVKSSFNPDIARLLQVKTSLLNSIKTLLLKGKSRVLLDFNSSFCLLGKVIMGLYLYLEIVNLLINVNFDKLFYYLDTYPRSGFH